MSMLIYGTRTEDTVKNDNDNQDFIYYCHDADDELSAVRELAKEGSFSFTILVHEHFEAKDRIGDRWILSFDYMCESQWVVPACLLK